MIDFKKYKQDEISKKEASFVSGGKGRIERRVLRDVNQYGLPAGIYMYNTETGGVWDCLGNYRGSWCNFGD